MRVYLIILFSIISISGLFAQSSNDKAKKAYQEGDFDAAISLLESDIKTESVKGKSSVELYYNLGNAYFKKNEMAKAILNYERALLLNPRDKDIIHNIEFVNKKIEDKAEVHDHSFFSIGFDYLKEIFSSNTWAVLSIVFFIIFILSLGLFIFTPKLFFKKVGFYTAITFFVLLVFTNIFAYQQKKDLVDRKTAIVMFPVVNVMSSPSNSSNKVFVLHEGTKIKIRNIDENWVEIEIADGNRGWLELSKIEII